MQIWNKIFAMCWDYYFCLGYTTTFRKLFLRLRVTAAKIPGTKFLCVGYPLRFWKNKMCKRV